MTNCSRSCYRRKYPAQTLKMLPKLRVYFWRVRNLCIGIHHQPFLAPAKCWLPRTSLLLLAVKKHLFQYQCQPAITASSAARVADTRLEEGWGQQGRRGSCWFTLFILFSIVKTVFSQGLPTSQQTSRRLTWGPQRAAWRLPNNGGIYPQKCTFTHQQLTACQQGNCSVRRWRG